MKRHAQMSDAQRQLFPLLEHEYREDVRVYMYEMQVSRALSPSPDWSGAVDPRTPSREGEKRQGERDELTLAVILRVYADQNDGER
jgi:hypothetical protein